jgi:hypothetical protein
MQQGKNDMNIDNSDAENVVLQKDGDGDGDTGAQSARSGGRRKDPDPAFTPGLEFEMENQGYTPVTRRTTGATRATSPLLNLRATKKANQKAVSRIMKSERKNSVEAT